MGENNKNHHRTYKRTSISRSPEELRKRRVAIDETLRKKHREQLITAKRFRHLTRREEQESAGESEPEDEVNLHDADIDPYYRLNKEEVAMLAENLKSEEKSVREKAMQDFGKFLVEPAQALIDYVVDGDCLETLTLMLTGTESDERIQAAQTISNIAAGPYSLWAKSIPTAPYLIQMLDSDNSTTRETAAVALGNMAAEELGDMTDEDDLARDTIRKNGALLPLAKMLDTSDPRLVQSACFALANLARGQETQLHEFITAGVPEKLLRHLENETVDTITEICGVMSYLAAGSQEFRDKVIQENFLTPLVKNFSLLAAEGPVVLPVLRTLGHIASGPDEATEILIQQDDFLSTIATLLQSENRVVLKETVWIVSSVTAAKSQNVIDKIEKAGIIPTLVNLVKRPSFDVRTGAAECIMNLAVQSEKHMESLPHRELLPEFSSLIRSQEAKPMRFGLDYVEMLLNKVPNGKTVIDETPECLEALASVNPAPDQDLYTFANRLVDQYYGEIPDMCE